MNNFYKIADIGLADKGKKEIDWALERMPVLKIIREKLEKIKPFKDLKIIVCAHVTKETAALIITLKKAGGRPVLISADRLSTQDSVAASLVKHYQIPVFAAKGESFEQYQQNMIDVIGYNAEIVMDEGAEVIANMLEFDPNKIKNIKCATEKTTTGITRLDLIYKQEELNFPTIGVNESQVKYMFDNQYGTGQSTLNAIIQATNILVAGQTVVVVGYGWCGKGCAARAKGLGAQVIVNEINPIKALQALMDGFNVMTLEEACSQGDIFITVTGNRHVIDVKHFLKMKDGAIVCNAGHFDIELNLDGLKEITREIVKPKFLVEEYILKSRKRIFILAEGKLVNLAISTGNPSVVMDLTFSSQTLALDYLLKFHKKLKDKINILPSKINIKIAKYKLKSMDIKIDKPTKNMNPFYRNWNV